MKLSSKECEPQKEDPVKQRKACRNILILGSSFLPKPTANGVCLINIAREYVKDGHNVFCIAAKDPGQKEYEVIEGIPIYRIKRGWFSGFHDKFASGGKISKAFEKVVHMVRNICVLPFFPNVCAIRAQKVYKTAWKVIEEKQIDTVIASYGPYEMIHTVLRLKKKFAERLYCVSYYLDYLRLNRGTSRLARAYYDRRCIRAQKRDLQSLDRVVIPIANREEFEKTYGVHPNVVFAELPVYIPEAGAPMAELPFGSDTRNLVFVGSLNTWNRSPERLLALLQAVSEKLPDIRLHIWGNITNTGDILRQYDSIVEYHGYTESKYIPTILQKADWVVNISNARDYHLVPSKIFQLFASGKPVLNYMFHRTDGSSPYFERYPNTYTVYDDQADDPAVVEELIRALQRPWPPVNADDAFTENTPKAVAEKLLM